MLCLWGFNMIEEHHAYRNKDKVINELLQRIALLERAIEEKEKVIEEVREYIDNEAIVEELNSRYTYITVKKEDILEILKGE